MFKHHEESIQKLSDYYSGNPSVLAVILVGSVAKGTARPNSDLDAWVIVTDNYYAELEKEFRTYEVITGHSTYEGGYFDIIYNTKEMLEAAAIRGAEAYRAAFVNARLIYCADNEIEEILAKVAIFQEKEKDRKMLSFYSNFVVNYNYYWRVSKDDIFLRARTATNIVLFGFRLLLQNSNELYPGHKPVMGVIKKLANKPDNIVCKAEKLLSTMDDDAAKDFFDSIINFINFDTPSNAEVGVRYTLDNALWWYKERVNVAEL